MVDQAPGSRKQTQKPKTIAEQIADAEARHSAADKAERNREYFRRHWQKFKQTKARIYGTVSKAEYDEIAERAIAQGRHRQRKDGTLQANVFEQLIAEARAYNAQTYLPSKSRRGDDHQTARAAAQDRNQPQSDRPPVEYLRAHRNR